jgi:SAM-dependent methyltransferase
VPAWTRAQLRHVARLFRYGRHPAATVYESLGTDVFGAFEPGWLNLGLWEGRGDEAEAPVAPRRLVEALCAGLGTGGTVLDVGNGLGAQDPVIAERLAPKRLVAVNVSRFQLRAGRADLAAAGAAPVCADAVRLPIATGTVDTVLSVEAPFHFASRAAFFAEAARVLRPGGQLSASDFVVRRRPRDPLEALAGLWTMRFWGLRRSAVQTAAEVAAQLCAAGFVDVQVHPCGPVVIDPALRVIGERFATRRDRPLLQRWGARAMVAQWRFLRRRGLLDYVLVRATAPGAPDAGPQAP